MPPDKLFNDPLSIVIESKDNKLLAAHIASDGQWRFPVIDSVPEKIASALILYEDKRFNSHPGIDPIAICRALYLNFKNKKIVSGGSTITMQVVRLSRKEKPRNYYQKVLEIAKAIKIEIHYSKKNILSLYASHAPFGGNVVGVNTASWRYFSKSTKDLTWAEASLLSVLPNSPALIHPGKYRNELLEKRNSLLYRLYLEGFFSIQLFLALSLFAASSIRPGSPCAQHCALERDGQQPPYHRCLIWAGHLYCPLCMEAG